MNRFIIEDYFDFDHSEFLTIYWFICQFDNLLDKFLSYKYIYIGMYCAQSVSIHRSFILWVIYGQLLGAIGQSGWV